MEYTNTCKMVGKTLYVWSEFRWRSLSLTLQSGCVQSRTTDNQTLNDCCKMQWKWQLERTFSQTQRTTFLCFIPLGHAATTAAGTRGLRLTNFFTVGNAWTPPKCKRQRAHQQGVVTFSTSGWPYSYLCWWINGAIWCWINALLSKTGFMSTGSEGVQARTNMKHECLENHNLVNATSLSSWASKHRPFGCW